MITLVSQSWTPGANMMHEVRTVSKSNRAYINLAPVELEQKPEQREQPALTAADPKQQAKLDKLKMPPIF